MMNKPSTRSTPGGIAICLGLALLGTLSACDRTPKPEVASGPVAAVPMASASAASR